MIEERARRERAAKRVEVMVIRKGALGQPEVDLSPTRGVEAISLATRLSAQCFSLAGLAVASYSRTSLPVRFVPRIGA